MRWVGGGCCHVHRSGRPYPGETRFMAPKTLNVRPPKIPLDWRSLITETLLIIEFFAAVITLCVMLALTFG